MTFVYIDSDVFISSKFRKEKFHKESKKFIDFLLKNTPNDITFVTSEFTFVELASATIRRTRNKDKALALLYTVRNTWKKKIVPLKLKPHKIKSTDYIESLIQATLNFKTRAADTIHARAIEEHKIDYLITWNKKDFLKLKKIIKNLKIKTPIEILKELEKKNKKIKVTVIDLTQIFKTIKETEKKLKHIKRIRNEIAHSKK